MARSIDLHEKMNIHRDYSMENAHERFLFTSCDASKKRTGERLHVSSITYISLQFLVYFPRPYVERIKMQNMN